MKVGVVGIGYWGSKCLEEYQRLVGEDLLDEVVTCDINPDKNPDFTNFDKFTEYVDAMHVCTNNKTHYNLAKKALSAGKHVLIEKPMTQSSWRDIDLIALAKSKNLILQVGFIWLHSDVIKEINNLIKSNYFGRVYSLKFRWSNKQPLLDRDVVWDLLPHPLSITLILLNHKHPIKISKMSSRYRREFLDELAFINFKFPTGILVGVELNWIQNPKIRQLEVAGSKRSAFVNLRKQMIVTYHDNGVEKTYQTMNNTIYSEAKHFIESINSGNSEIETAELGSEVTEIIERVMNGCTK